MLRNTEVWRKGQTRHQHLCGLFPNPYPDHWEKLQDLFQIHFGRNNAAYRKLILLVLPGTKHLYEQRYPELIERGLEIREARLHKSEWTSASYGAFLNSVGGLGQSKAQYQAFLHDQLALGEEGMHPRELLRRFDESGLGGAVKAAVRSHLQVMMDMTSEQEYVREVVSERGVPVVALFESKKKGPRLIQALEMAVVNALSGELPGDPFIWFIVEEAGKHLKDEYVRGNVEEWAKEIRHGKKGYYLGGHLVTDFSPDMVSLASGVFQFRGSTPVAHRKLVELKYQFHNVKPAQVAKLEKGQAYGVFQLASNGLYMNEAQLYDIRPTCVWAGGETMTVV